jgi:hypothetical protein
MLLMNYSDWCWCVVYEHRLREDEKIATSNVNSTATPAKPAAVVIPVPPHTPSFGAQPAPGTTPSAPNSALLPQSASSTSAGYPLHSARRTPRGYAQLTSVKARQQQQQQMMTSGALVPPATAGGTTSNSNATTAAPTTGAAASTAAAAAAAAYTNANPYALSPEMGHRFKTLLEESVERLQLLGLITADANRRRDVPSKANRKDIFSLMLNQRQLEESYAELMARKNQLRGLSNKSKLAQVMVRCVYSRRRRMH